MRSCSHSLDWINKLYDDSMLEYDQSLIDRLKADPKRTVVFPDAADQAGGSRCVRARDPGMDREAAAKRRTVQGGDRRNREDPREQVDRACCATLEHAAFAATRALSVVGLIALMGLAAMTLADGLMRWIANQPIEGVGDLSGLAIAVAITCCIPMAMIERSNITIRLAADASAALGRVLEVIAAAVVALVLGGHRLADLAVRRQDGARA